MHNNGLATLGEVDAVSGSNSGLGDTHGECNLNAKGRNKWKQTDLLRTHKKKPISFTEATSPEVPFAQFGDF